MSALQDPPCNIDPHHCGGEIEIEPIIMAKNLDSLLRIATDNARKFNDPSAALERRRYRGEHPTEIAALKCMDGRLHIPIITETPLGIIQSHRNIGGRFNLGWLGFQEIISRWVDYSTGSGRHCLVLVTYHYSRGDHHRGCAGFGYDTEEAKRSAFQLKAQFDHVFGKTAVHAIVCGIETDYESLILHGESKQIVDLADFPVNDHESLKHLLSDLYPSMHEDIRRDFLPLVQGNTRHTAKTKASNRPVNDIEHCEWVLAVGRGFDWLHMINTALIVGPFDPEIEKAIATAGGLLLKNIKENRVEDRVVLMSSALYRDSGGYQAELAAEKAKFNRRFTEDVLKRHVPELMKYIEQAAVRVDFNTRELEVLERC